MSFFTNEKPKKGRSLASMMADYKSGADDDKYGFRSAGEGRSQEDVASDDAVRQSYFDKSKNAAEVESAGNALNAVSQKYDSDISASRGKSVLSTALNLLLGSHENPLISYDTQALSSGGTLNAEWMKNINRMGDALYGAKAREDAAAEQTLRDERRAELEKIYNDISESQSYKTYEGDPSKQLSYLRQDTNIDTDYMNEDDLRMFDYLTATYGSQTGLDYLGYVEKEINQRKAAETNAEWQKKADELPVLSSVYGLGTRVATGIPSAASNALTFLTGGELDANRGTNLDRQNAQTIYNTVSNKLGNVGGFVYSTAMSALENIADMAVGSALGLSPVATEGLVLTLMSSGAASDELVRAKDEGLSDTQAFVKGVTAGLIESLTEKASLEVILDPNRITEQAWKYLLKSAAAEGSEEVTSDILNYLFENNLLGDGSAFRKSVSAYMEDGMTESAAAAHAIADNIPEWALDGLAGALSGLGMAGAVKAGDAITGRYVNKGKQKFVDTDNGSSPATSGLNTDQLIETADATIDDESSADFRTVAEQAAKEKAKHGKVSNDTAARLEYAFQEFESANYEKADEASKRVDSWAKKINEKISDESLVSLSNLVRSTGLEAEIRDMYTDGFFGNEATVNDTTSAQERIAYNLGKMDAITYESEVLNEKTENGLRLLDGTQWNAGTDSIGKGGVMESLSEVVESGRSVTTAGGYEINSENFVAEVNLSDNFPETFKTATNVAEVKNTTADTAAAYKYLTDNGFKASDIHFFVGASETKNGFNGFIDNKSGQVWISADAIVAPEQIAKHENAHRRVKTGELSVKDFRDKIYKRFGKKDADSMLSLYRDTYGGDFDEVYYMEEILADAIAGMNVFDGVESVETLFTNESVSLVKENVAEQKQSRAPPEGSDVKMSKILDYGTANEVVEAMESVSDSEVFRDSRSAILFSIRVPYTEGTNAYNEFVEGLDSEARKTYELFHNFYRISKLTNVRNLKGDIVKNLNISSVFMTASVWNEKIAADKKWNDCARRLSGSLPENVRTSMRFNLDGTLTLDPLESEFKMQKSLAQRLVDALMYENIDKEYVIGDKKIILDTAGSTQSVGGEAYRRALIAETRKLYSSGKLSKVSIASLSRDRWGSLGFLAENGKTGASGDLTTICPQMMFNRGCFYCYRRAALESGVNNKLCAASVWYTGEILRIKDEDVKALNENGGLRIQSFGDWMPHFSAQLADILYDAELRGLQVKIITKEPSMISYVARLREQGIGKSLYFNLSADYVVEKGPEKISNTGNESLDKVNPERPFNRDESNIFWWKRAMSVEEAFSFRKMYPFVNVRIVATTLDEFIRGLQDDRVQVVTGYHGKIRSFERIDSSTGHMIVNVEPLGDAGMPRFNFSNGEWNIEYEGYNKYQKALARAIQDKGLQLEYYNKSCCITGRCASCKGKCGALADSFSTKNATNIDNEGYVYWKERMTSAQEDETERIDTRFSRSLDSEYLSLAEHPEQNEKRLREMVDDAAKKAGYNSPHLYHGTNFFGWTKYKDDNYVFFSPSQIKSADLVTYDDSGNIIPLSERFNSNNADIRFSKPADNYRKEMLDEFDRILKENRAALTSEKISDITRRATKKLVKEWKSTADVADDFKTVVNEMLKPDADITYTDKLVSNMAERILHDAYGQIIDETDDSYKRVQEYARSKHGISISKRDQADIPDFNDWRKSNFGRINITNNGTPIDTIWSELQDAAGRGAFPDEVTHPADMLLHLEAYLRNMATQYGNPWTTTMGKDAIFAIEDDIYNTVLKTAEQITNVKSNTSYSKEEMRNAAAELASNEDRFHQMAQDRMNAYIEWSKNERAKMAAEALTNMKKAVDEVRKTSSEMMDMQKKSFEAQSKKDAIRRAEQERRKQYVESIERVRDELSQKLLRPTDKKHIPYQMKETVAGVLSVINTASTYYDGGYKLTGAATERTKKFEKLRDYFREIASRDDQGNVVIDPSMIADNGDLDKVIKIGARSILDMNSTELRTVNNVLQATKKAVQSYDRMLSDSRYDTVSDFANGLYFENRDKEHTDVRFPNLENKFITNNLTPEAYFHRLGSLGDTIFRIMRNAQDDVTMKLKSTADWVADNVGANAYNLDHEMRSVMIHGKEEMIPVSYLMEFYALYQRKAANFHIANESGGIKLQPRKENAVAKTHFFGTFRNLTHTDINNLFGALKPDEIAAAEKLRSYMKVCEEWGNNATRTVYGYDKFGEPDYWPMKVSSNDLKSDIGENRGVVTSVRGYGLAQELKPKADQALVIGSIFDTFTEHVRQMANYSAWLSPMEDINRIRNFTFRNDNGKRSSTMKEVLDNVYGHGGASYLQNLLSDIAAVPTFGRESFGKLLGSAKAAAVGMNLRVTLQQPTAILRAMDMIDAKYIFKAEKMNALKGWEKAKKNSAIAQWKDFGYFDIGVGQSTRDIIFDNTSLKARADKISSFGPGFMDSVGWGWLWNAVELEMKAKSQKTGADLENAIADRFTEIIDRTQVVDGVLQRSENMRQSSGLMKQITSFMAEPTKQLNMFMTSLYDYQHTTGEAKKKAAQRLARTSFSVLFAGSINAIVQSVVDAIRNRDREKDYWEKFLAALVGAEGDDTTVLSVLFSNLGDVFNPANDVPILKDIISLIQGYDVSRMDMDLIADVVSSVKQLFTSTKYTAAESLTNLANSVAAFLGIPATNLKRDLSGVITTMLQATDAYALEYLWYRMTYKVDGNKSLYKSLLSEAKENNTDAYNYIVDDLKRTYGSSETEKLLKSIK